MMENEMDRINGGWKEYQTRLPGPMDGDQDCAEG